MTRTLIARRGFAALLAGSALLLAACGGSGGGSSDGNAAWRVVNLTEDVPSIDVYSGTTKSFAAVDVGTATTGATIATGSYTIKVTAKDDVTTILGESFTFSPSKDKTFTSVVTGQKGTAIVRNLLDDEDTSGVAEGTSRVRVLNMATDSGGLDVYISNADDITTGVTANFQSPTQKQAVGFKDVSSGTYRLRVTAAGIPTDVRLDVSGLTIKSKEASTIVLTSAASGAQVNAALIVQGGSVTRFTNTQARLRVVAGASNGAAVITTIDGVAFGSTLLSPTQGTYKTVAAGTHSVAVSIDGTTVNTSSQTFKAGGDYTLVVTGSAASPLTPQFLEDDNSLPTAGYFRIRMVHADANYGALTASINGDTPKQFDEVAQNTTSAPATQLLTVADASSIEVDTVSPIQVVGTVSRTLASQGVYTLFVIGGKTDSGTGNAVPEIRLSKDR